MTLTKKFHSTDFKPGLLDLCNEKYRVPVKFHNLFTDWLKTNNPIIFNDGIVLDENTKYYSVVASLSCMFLEHIGKEIVITTTLRGTQFINYPAIGYEHEEHVLDLLTQHFGIHRGFVDQLVEWGFYVFQVDRYLEVYNKWVTVV